jgi:predicted solute-binding protein
MTLEGTIGMMKLATVSYLNARPLIDGLERETDIAVIRRVPSRLLETLETGGASIALCPVIDFQRSAAGLEIVPAGAIGCDGPALTVKLFSTRPIAELESITVDGESHTSVALLGIVMREIYGRVPTLRPPGRAEEETPQALLLIGDKVITATPDRTIYPHELDLGAAWKKISGKPFVFAAWMTRIGCNLGDLPRRLDRIRSANRGRLDRIAARHAAADGWPEALAFEYLSRNLRYELGEPELAGIEDFWRRCHEHGIIDELRPMRLYGSEDGEEVRR